MNRRDFSAQLAATGLGAAASPLFIAGPAAAYKLDGVPTVAVQGRWATSPGQAGGPEQAMAVTDYLLQRARTKA